MFTFVVVAHVIVCILLIFLVLIQAGKGGGLSQAFGGGGGGGAMNSLFGTKSTTVLTKVTIALVVLFLLTSLFLTILGKIKSTSLMERVKDEDTQETDEKSKDSEDEPLELPLKPGTGNMPTTR